MFKQTALSFSPIFLEQCPSTGPSIFGITEAQNLFNNSQPNNTKEKKNSEEESISGSQAYAKAVEGLQRLCQVDMRQMSSGDERLAFYGNLATLMILHCHLDTLETGVKVHSVIHHPY